MKRKTAPKLAPTCAACGRAGAGITFAIFCPRFPPFGTVCTDCEATLPAGTTVAGGIVTRPTAVLA